MDSGENITSLVEVMMMGKKDARIGGKGRKIGKRKYSRKERQRNMMK